MRIKVLPYVTIEIDQAWRRRLSDTGERARLAATAYVRSAADDVDLAGGKVRGLCDAAVDRINAFAASVDDKVAPADRSDRSHLKAV